MCAIASIHAGLRLSGIEKTFANLWTVKNCLFFKQLYARIA
jgi:hypothetical protein